VGSTIAFKPLQLHFPLSLSLGGVDILLHTIFETLAFIIGFRYFLYVRKRKGDTIHSSNRTWIIIGAIFGGLFGSRLVGGLEDPTQIAKAGNILFYFYQNKTVLGGFLGGLFGVELIKQTIGEKKASGDLFVYPIILALIIGRIGCFTMGIYEETYGLPSNVPWAMNLGDGINRHPVALYEIVFLILLWISLRRIQTIYELANGALFKIFMIAYILFRLLLDFIKPHFSFPLGLSTIQLACILGLLYYLPFIVKPGKLLSNA
jgi:phosphatidylglycerol:prolipoprotein diacylglycerol transferase